MDEITTTTYLGRTYSVGDKFINNIVKKNSDGTKGLYPCQYIIDHMYTHNDQVYVAYYYPNGEKIAKTFNPDGSVTMIKVFVVDIASFCKIGRSPIFPVPTPDEIAAQPKVPYVPGTPPPPPPTLPPTT